MLANVLLSAVKFLAGVFGNSQALIADAIHSLSDVGTDVAVLVGVRYWAAPADETHPHGHGRIETLVTVFIGALLALAGATVGYRALASMDAPHSQPPAWIAFSAAPVSWK